MRCPLPLGWEKEKATLFPAGELVPLMCSLPFWEDRESVSPHFFPGLFMSPSRQEEKKPTQIVGVYFGHFSFYTEDNVNPRTGKKNTFPTHTFPAVVFLASFSFFITQWKSRELGRWKRKARLHLLLTKRRQRKRSPSILAMQKVINISTGVTDCSSFCSLSADRIDFFQSQVTVMLLDQ